MQLAATASFLHSYIYASMCTYAREIRPCRAPSLSRRALQTGASLSLFLLHFLFLSFFLSVSQSLTSYRISPVRERRLKIESAFRGFLVRSSYRYAKFIGMRSRDRRQTNAYTDFTYQTVFVLYTRYIYIIQLSFCQTVFMPCLYYTPNRPRIIHSSSASIIPPPQI